MNMLATASSPGVVTAEAAVQSRYPVERTATPMAQTLPPVHAGTVQEQIDALDRGLLDLAAKVDRFLGEIRAALPPAEPQRPRLTLIQGGRN